MEDAREDTRGGYWCYMCNQMIDPVVEVEAMKCPLCLGGFVEEMATTPATSSQGGHNPTDFEGGLDSERSISVWAPILLGLMSNSPRRHLHRQGDIELDRELESIDRRRSSPSFLQLLQGIQAGIQSEESENNNAESDFFRDSDHQSNNIRERERVILINPFNQTVTVHSSYGSSNNNSENPIGSLGDYFMGPGLDRLLQHLVENDPNRYGTPPAQKDAVEAMPSVIIEEHLQCSVCLEDLEVGAEAKEMPCKHRFHSRCILPWLELHSSCPVCRHQLPTDETKLNNSEMLGTNHSGNNNNSNNGEEASNGNGRQFSVPLPWPFSYLFSSSRS